ncbi:MAG: hypothetical protein ACYDAR_12855 [Thermomicrobiales bacterium]
MTDGLSIGLTKLLRKAQMAEDVDFLREGMRVFSAAVMALEVTQHVGAERHARTPDVIARRLSGLLARRGYGYDIVRTVLKTLRDNGELNGDIATDAMEEHED